MPVKKEDASTKASPKTSSTRKTPVRKTTSTTTVAAKSPSVKKAVAANTRHIEENAKTIENNSKLIHILYGAIIILMMIIAALAFYVGTMYGKPSITPWNSWTTVINTTAEDITITVIDDIRCSDCQTSAIVDQLRGLPFLAWATIIEQDFSDSWVAELMEENNLSNIPTVLFSTNALADGGQIVPYLTPINNGQFSLTLPQTFNPFAKRSENGFLLTSDEIVQSLQETAYYEWASDAKITWIEYTDVNCHYCKKMASDKTAEIVLEKFPETLNKNTVNYIGVWGQSTQIAAEALECIASFWWADAYNNAMKNTLLSGDSSRSAIIALGTESGIDSSSLESCIDNGDVKDLVASKFDIARNAFSVTWTPGNIILNNETGEYELISWAYPATAFEDVINRMLAE